MATETADPPTTGTDELLTIPLRVPNEVARRYRAATEDERRVWAVALAVQFRLMVAPPARTVEQTMADLARQAAANGFTEADTQAALAEWDAERKARRATGA
ncbi:MAG: hypothetical protein U0871_21005 [Gemmataceae bacterium]